ncbi:alpha-amylase [Flavobacterium noncentrifugens]|uniref:Maltogenic Amylase, C-terminal domain n=1 Tax=Flavobacterium noncentrifugens TaxID=1128970 RepID=A0A1G8XSZ8_9FLAO|nr:alpha-amylase family glycosyl hydrolase [Flavobacterium noncentrifugens]GEP52176.1 alpha-amylase [Flavobacterium noncentrifugens]SDJ93719.1 Maltogenic Amylase, C-terminal domain [Flavobacterium noncentrifugens]
MTLSHKMVLAASFLTLISCTKNETKTTVTITGDARYQPKEYVELKHPDWSKNATIYEVNVRQFTPEGTFKAFEAHLPRIKAMGIDIIWLMPIHPIGVEKRKGTLGSEYSVKDYYGVNPEFGTKEDFKHLVDKIHSMGMHVIIDWVANHSAWDNPLAKEHPDWYSKTPEGNFQPTPWYDWDDVIDFDYEKPELRKYMTQALVYWVKDFNIDGYRCDTAGFLPTDFWDNARAEMDAVKPVFMLAEWESRDLHQKAFDMTYSWTLWNNMAAVTRDKKSIAGLVEYMAHDVSTFPRNGYRMTFTDNHDMNSWNGNQIANFGDGLEASMVLCGTINGMPLVYGGQEAGLDHSLKFFDKDLIDWSKMPYESLFKKLFELKHNNHALWNGNQGGVMIRIFNDKPEQVLSFSRSMEGDQVIPVINYSAKPVTVKLDSKYQKGKYQELFTGKEYELKGDDVLSLEPWKYLVLVKQK